MTVEYYIQNPSQYPHERSALVGLAQHLQRAFAMSDRLYVLAVNVRYWQAQIDALVIAPHAITLIELKSCDAPVYGRPHNPWHTLPDKSRLRSGNTENPYQQITAQRQSLIKYLDRNRRRFIIGDRARTLKGKWGHISAALVFSPFLNPNSDIIVPQQTHAWLGIIGLNEVPEFLFSRVSSQIDLRPHEMRSLVQDVLACRRWTDIQTLLPLTRNLGHLWILNQAHHKTYAFPIVDGATIGRSRDNTLVIPQRFDHTSRYHAYLQVHGDTVWLFDNNSSHGTHINGKCLAQNQGNPLKEGAKITLGTPNHPNACALKFERRIENALRTNATSDTIP